MKKWKKWERWEIKTDKNLEIEKIIECILCIYFTDPVYIYPPIILHILKTFIT